LLFPDFCCALSTQLNSTQLNSNPARPAQSILTDPAKFADGRPYPLWWTVSSDDFASVHGGSADLLVSVDRAAAGAGDASSTFPAGAAASAAAAAVDPRRDSDSRRQLASLVSPSIAPVLLALQLFGCVIITGEIPRGIKEPRGEAGFLKHKFLRSNLQVTGHDPSVARTVVNDLWNRYGIAAQRIAEDITVQRTANSGPAHLIHDRKLLSFASFNGVLPDGERPEVLYVHQHTLAAWLQDPTETELETAQRLQKLPASGPV
jgi:hypothetical protein